MIFFVFAFVLMLLPACGAIAEKTNGFSNAEIQGRALAQKILAQLEQRPAEGSTNTGVLKIRDPKGRETQVSFVLKVVVTATNWETIYAANTTNGVEQLTLVCAPNQSGKLSYHSPVPFSTFGDTSLFDHLFAGSDFSVGDLDLEFFNWTNQKIIKREFRRGCGCMVLESTNPHPSTNGYSRVDSWIDEKTLGIVHAEAYDAQGRLLKLFDPKSFKKVDGQWELQEMEIRNVQTGSRTWMKFDLNRVERRA